MWIMRPGTQVLHNSRLRFDSTRLPYIPRNGFGGGMKLSCCCGLHSRKKISSPTSRRRPIGPRKASTPPPGHRAASTLLVRRLFTLLVNVENEVGWDQTENL